LTRSYLRPSPLAERQEAKALLRKAVLGRRHAMDPRIRTALSQAIVQDLFDLAAYRRSGTVMAYVGFGSELQTDEFVLHTLEQGKTLLLPRVNRRKRGLDIYEVRDPGQDLEERLWGIREPRPDRCARVDSNIIDFVLVPGLAFDAQGGRLGYGGGFYDRLLASILSTRTWLVAGAFETQLIKDTSLEQDVPMDVVVTENGHYPPGPLPRWASH
jgi:5-formyltetrahydrofolate cyclo-ligase